MASRAKSSNLTVYDPKSGVRLRGVRKRPAGRYSAEIRDPEKKLRLLQLGYFNTPEEAARAYDASARKLLGPKAETNFPPEEEKKHDDTTTTTKEEGFGSTSQNDNAAAAASELILGSTAVVQSEDLLACPGTPDVNLSVTIGSCSEPSTPPHHDRGSEISLSAYGSSGLDGVRRQIEGTHEFRQQNYMYWTSFMNYLNCNQPGTELQPLARSITESNVIDYLGHLIKLRERKVYHHRTCPFTYFSPVVCSCQANDGLEGSLINIAYRPNEGLEESLHTIAYRLEDAFHYHHDQPDRSNPFTSQTVRNYLRVHESSTLIGTAAAAAGGSSHKGGGGGVVVYNAPSGSGTADSSTKKAYTLELEAEIDKLKEVNQRFNKGQEESDKSFTKPRELCTASQLVGSQEDLISQNLHQLNIGEISRQWKLDRLREDNNMVKQEGYSINELVQEAQTRWLKPAEVYFILQNYKDDQITVEVPQKPPSGSLFLFDKGVCRFFRKDGHSWSKKKDGRTVGEAHERLKVGNVEYINCYYAHGDQNPNFQRRSYWVLDPACEHIVLVHYREISENLHQLNLGEISHQRKLDGRSEDNNMVKQEAGSASSRNQTTSSRKRTGFGLNRLLFGITKKGRSKYTSPKKELMVLDETGNKSESVQTVDKWTEGASSSLNPRDNSSSCMAENITGTSPEKERFEDELKEAHSILRMDDDLVSFMDRKTFCLHILDLSGTTISCLPKCISELVTLESLTLRNCRLLMELPPEIGQLTNLKLLDLLGSEVVCLPREIAKLVNLRSFRIALCGYADHFKESRGIDSVIPRNALSKLSDLSDLRIHVNPDGDWWEVEVKAVIEDLRDLGNLRTLHLDLPKVDLLDDLMRSITQLLHLSSLRFRLTVGPHEEHIIHRLPKHVEKEFHDLERFEKGVKYTNSEGIPVEIKNALKYADAFLLERHWSVKNLLEFGVENMNELKCCILLECNELQTVIDAEECEDFYGSVLGSLECLSIHYMKKMEKIWRGPVMKDSLWNLKSLALHTCLSLTTVFTLDLLSNLMNLEELIIEDCPKIKTLVSSNSPNLIPQNFLPKLKMMLLLELPNLGCISSGVTIAPKLERLVIFYCPKLDKLSPVEISSRVLRVIKGEKRWWDALKWYESGATEEEQEYVAGKFVPLRKDEDLEEQFMRD